jgi:hypothetical protein
MRFAIIENARLSNQASGPAIAMTAMSDVIQEGKTALMQAINEHVPLVAAALLRHRADVKVTDDVRCETG